MAEPAQEPRSSQSLEEQVEQWRSYLRRRQAIRPVDVEELEDHLRGEVTALRGVGLSENEAFLVAVKRMGALDAISNEFAREHSERLWKQLVMSSAVSVRSGVEAQTEAIVVLALVALAALAVKVPSLFGLEWGADRALFRNAGFFVLPILTGYFVWKRRLNPRIWTWVALGFGVAFIRPRDTNAWLLLLLLMGFSGLTGSPDWHRSFPDVSLLWQTFCQATWALWMMLFAVHFPARLELDRRHPWLKYLIIVPGVLTEAIFWGILWLWTRDINAASRWRGLFLSLYFAHIVLQLLAVGAFFAALGYKWGTERAPDERRRLNILRTGASISLLPTFLIVLYSLIRDRDVFDVGVRARLPL